MNRIIYTSLFVFIGSMVSAQNVGINTDGSNPVMMLHVKTASSASDGILIENPNGGNGDGIITFRNNGSTDEWTLGFDDSDNDDFKISQSATIGTSNTLTIDGGTQQILAGNNGTNGDPIWSFEGDDNTGMYRSASDALNFSSGGTERLELGTTEAVFNDVSGNVDFRVESNGNQNMLFVDAGNDRVSIASANSTGEFNVTGQSYFSDDLFLRDGAVNSGDILARLYDDVDDGVLDIYRNNTVDFHLHANDNSYYNPNGSTNRVFMIGHNTPFYATLDMLEVNCAGANLYSVNGYTTSTGVSVYGENLASGIAVFGQGNGAANWAGYFAGDLNVTGTYYNFSDQRLKTNIVDFDGAINKLNELKVYTYNYKDGYNGLDPNKTQYGFMAQDLMQVFPEMVAEKTLQSSKTELQNGGVNEQVYAVAYMDLIPVLVEGIQEEDAKVEELETQVEELNKKIEELSLLITELQKQNSTNE